MAGASSLGFTTSARGLAAAARRLGLAVPAFRSPPRVAGAFRTLRRRDDGSVVVAVRLRDRSLAEVATDMIDGLLLANRIGESDTARLRPILLEAAIGSSDEAAA